VSHFSTNLQVWKRPDGRWELIDRLVYHSDLAGVIEVPAGFDTDYASIPRLPFMFWLLGDTVHSAAVVHDYLYRTAEVSRAKADRVFVEACEVEGSGWLSRWTMWSGLRVGGWTSYDQRHPENK
jgi:hypothetical protein